jgi:hypothetical protein
MGHERRLDKVRGRSIQPSTFAEVLHRSERALCAINWERLILGYGPTMPQAKDHRERAARFRRYADETSNSKNRETYLRVAKVEENLAATAERLGKEFQMDAAV